MVSSATATDSMVLSVVLMVEAEEDEDSAAVAVAVGARDDERVAPYSWDSPVTRGLNPLAAGVAGDDALNPNAAGA